MFLKDLYCRHVKTRACLEKCYTMCRHLGYRVLQSPINLQTTISLWLNWGASFSSTGRRPTSLCHGLLSVLCLSVRACMCPSIRASVGALTFSLNIFSETTYRIWMKFYRNVLAMSSSEFLERIRFLQKLWLPWQQNLKIFEIYENLLVRNHKA